MIGCITILSAVLMSASAAFLSHPLSIPTIFSVQVPQQHDANANYNFAYEVNDVHSGDIKSQSESKRGDFVLGQYKLVQPDGVTRTVEYKADSHNGFTATVNNDRSSVNQKADRQPDDDVNNAENEELQTARTINIGPHQNVVTNSGTQAAPMQISRSFILQSVPNRHEPLISSILHY